MNKFLKSILICALSVAVLTPGTCINALEKTSTETKATKTAPQTSNKRVVTYFPSWGIYQAGQQNIKVSDIAWDKVTHVHHAFFEIDNSYKIQTTDSYADFENEGMGHAPQADWNKYPSTGYPAGTVFGHFGEYKYYKEKYPNVKILISVGGWTRSEKFHELAKSDANMTTFANSMVDFMKKYPFIDGFDIDWEYPGITRAPEDQYDRGCVGGPEDKQNFTALLKKVRETFDANSMKDKLLTVAVSAGEEKIKATEPDKFAQYLDYIGIMTYDFAGAWDSVTGHLSPLYGNPADEKVRPKFNTNDAMKIYSEDYKVPKDKLLVGSPLYSRGWTNVQPGPNGDGLFQPGSGAGFKGNLGDGGQYSWYDLKKMENTGGWKKFVDPISKAPYLYNASTKQFLTYEDEDSLKAKVDYVNDNGYGGMIVWDASGDIVPDHPMHSIAYNGLVKNVPSNKPLKGALTVDNAANKGNYTVTASIPANSKATSYKLYENDKVVQSGAVTTDTLNFKYNAANMADGTYTYKLETINSDSTTISDNLSVTVSKTLPKPLAATLTVDKATNNGTYTVTASIPANSNASSYKLYENGTSVKTGDVAASASKITFDVKDKALGTYTYKIDTINADNTTTSSDLVVTVTKDLPPVDNATEKPGTPALSHNAWWGNTGNYTVTMNMYWGENGSQWKLYENGKLVSTKNLTYSATKASQIDSVSFSNKAKGTYTYKAELINSKGVSTSTEVTITIM